MVHLTDKPGRPKIILCVCRLNLKTLYKGLMYLQSKVTEIVKDSSDDLWFLEEDANSDQFSVDVYADEFDVMSERYSETDSDMDNLTSQEVRKATFFTI